MRLLEHLDEIVDEDIELQACEPLDLGRQRVLEIDVAVGQRRIRQRRSGLASRSQPARGVAEVDAVGILMTESGLVADDADLRAGLPARRQEFPHARIDLGAANSLAVDEALQALPGETRRRRGIAR